MTIKWTSSFTGLTENFEKEKLKKKKKFQQIYEYADIC